MCEIKSIARSLRKCHINIFTHDLSNSFSRLFTYIYVRAQSLINFFPLTQSKYSQVEKKEKKKFITNLKYMRVTNKHSIYVRICMRSGIQGT